MRVERRRLGLQCSTDGGRHWSDLDDATFAALLREWGASRAEVLTRLHAGELVRSPHVASFVYRAAAGQLALALEAAA